MTNSKGRQLSVDGNVADIERSASWKFVGYPGFSRFMASSNDCFALRKFATLNIRVLLKLQHDIVRMERRLDEMDNFTRNLPSGEGGSGSFRLDAESPREELLEEIDEALDKYNSRLVNFLQIHERPIPSPEQTRNIQTWLANYPDAIEGPEQEFILHEKDLFAIQLRRRTQFGRWMEAMGLYRIASLRHVDSKASEQYYDRETWKRLGGSWLVICILVMLLGPMWAMPFAHNQALRLSVVTAFAGAFCIMVIIGTTFKASQRGALVAGYFTQLVLVMGLTPTWQSNEDFAESRPVSSAPGSAFTTIVASSSVFTPATTAVATSALTALRPTSTQNASRHADDVSGLSPGAIAGIVVATILLCAIAFGTIFLYFRRRARIRSMQQPSVTPITSTRTIYAPLDLTPTSTSDMTNAVDDGSWAAMSPRSELPDHDTDMERSAGRIGHPGPCTRLKTMGEEVHTSSIAHPAYRFGVSINTAPEFNYEHDEESADHAPPGYSSVRSTMNNNRRLHSDAALSIASTLRPGSTSPVPAST